MINPISLRDIESGHLLIMYLVIYMRISYKHMVCIYAKESFFTDYLFWPEKFWHHYD